MKTYGGMEVQLQVQEAELKQAEIWTLLVPASAGFLLDILFELKEGGYILLRNGMSYANYRVLHNIVITVKPQSRHSINSDELSTVVNVNVGEGNL
jgi:hypothetical protein